MRFSEYFKLNKTQAYLDFVDVPLDTDIAVFLDPVAIKSLESSFGSELTFYLQSFFETVLVCMKNDEHEKAIKLLGGLTESNEFHLGYSRGKSQGRGFGSVSADVTWKALLKSKAVKTGLLKDLEDTALLIEGISTDKISDAVCNILREPLIKYTQEQCKYYDIKLTPNVTSGRIWNPQSKTWEDSKYLNLPMTDYGKVILVPKILVRSDISYSQRSYYQDYLLPVMQEEHLKNNSSLVQVLKKDKSRYVTKKDLMAIYGSDKSSIIKETLKRPEVFIEYKKDKELNIENPLSIREFTKIEEIEEIKINEFLKDLKNLPSGKKYAEEYEEIIESILSLIFYPSLCYPRKQHNIHEGRKRIDITYTNESREGFFSWLSQHYASAYIFVECKNYSKDIANPEIDQLSSRFSPNRGKIGLQVCRKLENKELFYKRCKDTANDDRGYILVLDDNDIEELVNEYILNESQQEFTLLRKQFEKLIE